MKTGKHLIAQAVAVSALVLAAATAQAQSPAPASAGPYLELGWTGITYKEAGYSIKPSMLRGLIGMELNPNLAVEGMIGFGASDDTIAIGGTRLTGEVDNAWGIFVKPKATVAPQLDVYGRLGYARTKISASIPGYSLSDSGGDIAYGVGASYKFSDKLSANLDYMSYYSKNGIKGTGMTLGLGFKF